MTNKTNGSPFGILHVRDYVPPIYFLVFLVLKDNQIHVIFLGSWLPLIWMRNRGREDSREYYQACWRISTSYVPNIVLRHA
jgi:hypothetical protein